ncbi:MAG: ABC transporter ATP-binding protein [Thermoplasmata archaeon]|nr:ABC transporter ATP-binding protein [Thermoplasmata archaeon]
MDAITVRGLEKAYGPVKAVNGIDFSVPAGTVFAFLGPNGAGKTTTTEVLEGLRNRTGGDVRVLGLDPWTDGAALHRRIGVIPQDFRFFEKIHPREAIEYYGVLFNVKPDAMALLEQVKLTDKADAMYETLSGGQKQKLGLALSLVSNPEVCFLDEPTTGLDPQARRAIWDVIRALKASGRTVFLTTHYLEEAALLADTVAIIDHGKIIVRGTPDEIIRQHGRPDRISVEAGPEVARYLQTKLGMTAVAANHHVDVELPEKTDALRVLQALEQSGLTWGRFSVIRDTLEDVFVRMVGKMDEGVVHPEASA